MRLKNKVAVITGGATGLGAATAVLYAQEGAKVVIADVNEMNGQGIAHSIESAGGVARFVRTDVAHEGNIMTMMTVVRENFGQLDVLVTCAGILLSPSTRVDQFEAEAWDGVINVNLKGTFLCVKHAVRLMANSDGGVILMIASDAGILGSSSSVAYGASKGGVQGLGLTLASQLEPLNIRTHVVLPGNMATQMRIGAIGEIAEKAGKSRQAAMAAERATLTGPEGTADFLADLASKVDGPAKEQLIVSANEWKRIHATKSS